MAVAHVEAKARLRNPQAAHQLPRGGCLAHLPLPVPRIAPKKVNMPRGRDSGFELQGLGEKNIPVQSAIERWYP